MPETTFDGNNLSQITDPNFILEPGNFYLVNYNGVSYTAECKWAEMDNQAILPVLGNIAADLGIPEGAYDESLNDLPFAIVNTPNQELVSGIYGTIQPLDGSTSITISILKIQEEVQKLPTKFLPDGYPHYDEYFGPVLRQKHYEWNDPEGNAIYYGETALPEDLLINGETYWVTVGDNWYQCEAFKDTSGIIRLGDDTFVNYPFAFVQVPSTLVSTAGAHWTLGVDHNVISDSGTYFGIYTIVRKYSKIDEKYIDIITIEEINEICGATIYSGEEVSL